MGPKSQEDTETLVRGPLVDRPLGTVLGFKTGYFPDFVVSFSAYFFEGLSDAFGDRLGNRLPWVFGSFSIGSLVIFIILYFTKIDECGLQKFK